MHPARRKTVDTEIIRIISVLLKVVSLNKGQQAIVIKTKACRDAPVSR